MQNMNEMNSRMMNWPGEVEMSFSSEESRCLMDLVSIGKEVVCFVKGQIDGRYCADAEALEQKVLGAMRDSGQGDDVWVDSEEGLLHHPELEEGIGAASQAIDYFMEECFRFRFVEDMASVLLRREGVSGDREIERRDYHERHLDELLEARGLDCLMLVPTAPAG